MIKNKSIKEINNDIKHLSNQLDYYLDIKYKNWLSTQPKSIDYAKDNTQGGSRVNKFEAYLIKDEMIDPDINELQNEIFRLTRYVERELERIGELEPLAKTICELRSENNKWEKISEITQYSIRQCQRIYKRCTNTRNIV